MRHERERARRRVNGPLLAVLAVGCLALAGPAAAQPAPPAPPDLPQAPPDLPDSLGQATFVSGEDTVLVGAVGRADLVGLHPSWLREYEEYRPAAEFVTALAGVTQPIEVVCVLGTWCSDSAREVPRFWKLLDLAGNPDVHLRMLAVARRDDEERVGPLLGELGFPAGIRAPYGVVLVPTFIFYHEGRELGRIEETPEISMESDTAAILSDLAPEPTPDLQQWR